MTSPSAFDNFAPALLSIYHKDREAFWSAVMAPFLAKQTSLLDWWGHLRVDLKLLAAFQGLDAEARNLLRDFSQPLGFDLTRWKSNRSQYFKDAYPVFAFLVVWMDDEGLHDLVASFGEVLRAGVFAVAGYGILDENVDSDQPSPVEVLTAQALIAEYESRALKVFGVNPANLEILHKMRRLFLDAEIKEKYCRHQSSPYRLNQPEELGAKGANAVAPFMLSLDKLGRADTIDSYWRVFLLFGAAIQMIDDWQDLEGDLSAGHYSYLTLMTQTDWRGEPRAAARMLRGEQHLVQATYDRSKEMIAEARQILTGLGDRHLYRMVDVTELRLEQYFRKELRLNGA